ncbi:formylglycine-generating enzyme family protein [Salegentibacter sp. BDJ18]|uniref:formylglycine-generating enzyme family protein n=1 Tax=Salegentibacter sp. BDJ18 TaxID=2816376 RepID=UPI001AAE7374|nr:formylglycine-generating enzyme family protein [Salegentibacter sp. BDJ18]MBO2543589.1 formylglycine-generating enzyme family protein [Salegentibacter sp. BDJ18]
MKFRDKLLIVLLLFFTTVGFSQQQDLENYTQEISGSDLVIEMVAIPAGTFIMGSPKKEENRFEDEGPANKVKIDAFWMSKYEITWELYNLFVNRAIDNVASSSKATDVDIEIDAVSGATIPYVDMSLGMGTGEDMPVGNVTHYAASKFCEWLSAKTGHFYRLPTEAEWEYVARAGTTTAFHFGDNVEELESYAWYYKNSDDSYHKVGQKKPNPWGLYDMYGNVAEWTLDQYLPEAYSNRESITENPLEIPVKEYPRSVRGGSYYDDAEFLRSAARLGSIENWKMRDPQFPKSKWWNTDAPYVGFRVIRVPHPPEITDYETFWGPRSL